MRILKIELENINSLKGFWRIDFTDPAYSRNHDIFVIHGPTGAGKTTLLDAITLALYGRTPRLEAVNDGAAGNELMTRGTGSCRASVTYQCKRGVFTSTFQQNRANGRASGRLQVPSYQIVKDDGSLVDTGKSPRALAEKTKELIQLDYDQFCRSIMLAQGEFSKFLKCSSRERAQILEKLTGTGKYRQIAQAVHARFSDLDRRFGSIKEEKAQVEKLVLTEEAECALKAQEKALQADYARSEQEALGIQKDLDGYDTLEKLEQNVKVARQAQEKSARELTAFSAAESRLLLAESARSCGESYASFAALRSADQGERAVCTASERQREGLSVSVKEAARLEGEAADRYAFLEAEVAALRSVWTEVRALDVQIGAAKKTSAETHVRKRSAEQALQAAEAALAALTEELSALAAEKAGLDAYIAGHREDERLPEIIARAETLAASLREQAEKRRKLSGERETAEKEAAAASGLAEKACAALSAIEAEIEAFVSKESLFIVRELQKQLTVGKGCPVCGAIYRGKGSLSAQGESAQGEFDFSQSAADSTSSASHPDIDSTDAATDSRTNIAPAASDAEKSRELALSSAELSARHEEAREAALQAQKKAEAAAAALELVSGRLSETEAAATAILEQIQKILAPWKEAVDEDSLAASVSALRKQSEVWQQQQAAATENARITAEKEASLSSLQQQLAERRDELLSLTQADQQAQAEEASLRESRRAAFGEKNVDSEEQAKTAALQQAKIQSDRAAEKARQAGEALARLEAQIEQLKASVARRQEKLSLAESDFQQRLSEQGFQDEEAFLSARMEEQELTRLQKKRDSLKREQVQAEAALSEALHAYEEYKAHASLTVPKEKLLADFRAVSEKREQTHRKLVDLQLELKTNDEQREKARRIEADYSAIQKEHALWKQMKDFVGVKDGDDLSVFVQSMAFNRLLSVTNKTLYGITGRYRIVQKSPASLDFAIDDAYCTDVRSVTNLSGGEQFLVSLSLALGISKFASHAVRVDSLFLDEGFGTLSGDLLTEAVNALKNLQKDGKMLGIITHVESVINEIDQKIEVRQVSGGHSLLIGDGISSSEPSTRGSLFS